MEERYHESDVLFKASKEREKLPEEDAGAAQDADSAHIGRLRQETDFFKRKVTVLLDFKLVG